MSIEYIPELDQRIKGLYEQAVEAATNAKLANLQHITRQIAELERLKDDEAQVTRRIQEALSKPCSKGDRAIAPVAQHLNSRNSELVIEVTGGMVREHYLALTPLIKRGKIHVGDEMTITVEPSGEVFKTTVLKKGNKLQERGAIRRFFADAEVEAGSSVVLAKNDEGSWTLRAAPLLGYG